MKIIKAVSLLITLCALSTVVRAEDEPAEDLMDQTNIAGTQPGFDPATGTYDQSEREFTVSDYSTDISASPLMCYASPNLSTDGTSDFCNWKANDFKLDIFDKLRTDEWQICSDEEGWSATDDSTWDSVKTYICNSRYPGNI